MATQWYYGLQGRRQGPLTVDQIKRLIADETIKRETLIWKAGMPDWTPAAEVAELFPDEGPRRVPTAGPPRPPQPPGDSGSSDAPLVVEPPPIEPSSAPRISLASFGQAVSVAGALVGLLLVLTTRGCEWTAQKYEDSIAGRLELDQAYYRHQIDEIEARATQGRQQINDDENASAAERAELIAELNQETQAAIEKVTEQQAARAESWRALRYERETARASTEYWSYYRAWTFSLGTFALTLGLAGCAFLLEGPPRWICLALLGIILLNLYGGIGGVVIR